MKAKWIILVLTVAVLAFGGLTLHLSRQVRQLKVASKPSLASLASNSATPLPAPTASTSSIPSTTAKEATLPEEQDADTASHDPATAAPAMASTNAGGDGESPMAGIARMMKNPGMKDMMRAQMKGQMEKLYGSLLPHLDLPEEDAAAFKELLLDKQMALVDLSMDMMGGAGTPEDRAAAAEAMKDAIAEHDARIKEFLGEERYELFEAYEQTQPERMQVNMFKASLGTGNELSVEQEDSLIRAMHDQRTNYKFSLEGFGGTQIDDPGKLTPEMVDKLIEENAKLQEQYLLKAAGILTPAQLEQFKINLKQHQDMMRMGMKMAQQMFGTKDSK